MTEHTAEAAFAHNASPALRLGGAWPPTGEPAPRLLARLLRGQEAPCAAMAARATEAAAALEARLGSAAGATCHERSCQAETAALLTDRTTDPVAEATDGRSRTSGSHGPDRRAGGRTSAGRGHPPAEAGPEAAESAAAITCRNPSVSASASGAVFGSKVHWEIRPVIRVT